MRLVSRTYPISMGRKRYFIQGCGEGISPRARPSLTRQGYRSILFILLIPLADSRPAHWMHLCQMGWHSKVPMVGRRPAGAGGLGETAGCQGRPPPAGVGTNSSMMGGDCPSADGWRVRYGSGFGINRPWTRPCTSPSGGFRESKDRPRRRS